VRHPGLASFAGRDPRPAQRVEAAAGSVAPLVVTAAAVAAMLDARSIALVGASPRPGSFGARMVAEMARSRGVRTVHLVNPRYTEIDGRPCHASLDELDEPVDVVLLGVGDAALAPELAAAARTGARSAVVYGSAHAAGLRDELREIATSAAMALCGGGCMGFVNVASGLRALGYLERDQIPSGPISVVTHSGSVFSALLRTRRALGYQLAISSGQELVTTTADYLDHIVDQTPTRVIGLVVEAIRDAPRLVAALTRASQRDIAVVMLPVGGSPLGAAMVSAHSGAIAGEFAVWEALAELTGALLVSDLAELTDTLELLSVARPARRHGAGVGIATVHDSGAERTLVADLADELGVPFAEIAPATTGRLAGLLDEGLEASNPLDVWGTGAQTRDLFRDCLDAMAADPNVAVVALAVDLVEEYDGDTSYPDAVLDVAGSADVPVVVLANLAAAIDQDAAARLRGHGVPVLEGTRSGLIALRHLLARAAPPPTAELSPAIDQARQRRWRDRLVGGAPLDAAESFALLADYGLTTVAVRLVSDEAATVAAAAELGYPVVLKTAEPGIAHKSDVGGVRLGIADEAAARAAYRDVSARLGPRTLVSATAPPGVELSVGIVRDAALGPLVVVAAGGVHIELLGDRAVICPPVSPARARRLVDRLRIRPLLDGWRGGPAADVEAVVAAISAVGQLAVELGDRLSALDVNPLVCGPSGAVAVDALVV
jgi:acyl-CoA synthetase (NDP forming)